MSAYSVRLAVMSVVIEAAALPKASVVADVSALGVVQDIAAGLGIDREALAEAVAGAELKDRLKTETDGAIAKGMFGAPYLIVDGEPFWGADRLPQLEKWLATGGF